MEILLKKSNDQLKFNVILNKYLKNANYEQ